MKSLFILIALAVIGAAISSDNSVLKSDGSLDPVKTHLFLKDIPKTYQTRAFNKFVTVPRPQDIGEGGIVFYSSDTRVCYLYTLQNSTTFSVKMTP